MIVKIDTERIQEMADEYNRVYQVNYWDGPNRRIRVSRSEQRRRAMEAALKIGRVEDAHK